MAIDGVPRAFDYAGGAGERGDVAIADLLRQGDGGDVERVCEGSGGSDHARVLTLHEVSGGVWLVGGAEVLGIVVELGERGENAAVAEGHAVERSVIGCGVDEGLEGGAGGTLGDGVIELRDAVVASAYEREDLPGVWVDGDERRPEGK